MSNSKERTVAIIPARGGSKGIPKKNLTALRTKPLLVYAIEVGLESKEIDRVILSTDEPEIAEVGIKYGAEVPFLRPAELAQDDTPDRPVFIHLIEWLRNNEGYVFDCLINLRCTTPLKKVEHIRQALHLMNTEDCSSVRTVHKIAAKYHPFWSLKLDEDGFGVPFVDGIDRTKYYQRQLLPPAYAINALVDVMKVETVLHCDNIYGLKMKLLETDPIYSIDIDTPGDLIICEAVMEKMNDMVPDGHFKMPHLWPGQNAPPPYQCSVETPTRD